MFGNNTNRTATGDGYHVSAKEEQRLKFSEIERLSKENEELKKQLEELQQDKLVEENINLKKKVDNLQSKLEVYEAGAQATVKAENEQLKLQVTQLATDNKQLQEQSNTGVRMLDCIGVQSVLRQAFNNDRITAMAVGDGLVISNFFGEELSQLQLIMAAKWRFDTINQIADTMRPMQFADLTARLNLQAVSPLFWPCFYRTSGGEDGKPTMHYFMPADPRYVDAMEAEFLMVVAAKYADNSYLKDFIEHVSSLDGEEHYFTQGENLLVPFKLTKVQSFLGEIHPLKQLGIGHFNVVADKAFCDSTMLSVRYLWSCHFDGVSLQ